jgi:hypothetical protein
MSNASSYRGEPGTVQPLQARLCSWKQGVISTITPADRALYQHFFAHDHRHACYGNYNYPKKRDHKKRNTL